MKKLLFLGLVALSLATACNKSIVVDEPNHQSAIGFDSFVGKSTKADVSTSTLDQFYVYGYTWKAGNSEPGVAVFTKQEVTHNTSDGACTYAPLRYWIAGNNYCFTAIGPNDTGWEYTPGEHLATATNPNANGCGTIKFNNSTAAANVDLIAAYSAVTNAAANQSIVGFTFKHLLSRVRFKFENHFASSGVALQISNISLTVDTEATYNMSEGTPTWTKTASNSTMSIPFTKASNQAYCTNESPWTTIHKYILPLQEAYVVTFTVNMFSVDNNTEPATYISTGTSNKTVTLPSTAFTPGYSYEFVAALDESNAMNTELKPIEFTVSGIANWENFSSVNVPMLGLSATAITLNDTNSSKTVAAAATYGAENTYTVEYSCATSDETCATAVMNDNVCTITKVAAGTATVTITATIKKDATTVGTVSKEVTVTVQ